MPEPLGPSAMMLFNEPTAHSSWIPALRARVLPYAALFGVIFCVTFHLNIYARSLTDPAQDLYGHDYISFYAAGRLALEGNPAGAYDAAIHGTRQIAVNQAARGGGDNAYYYFGYPPTYLTIVAGFAGLPYYASLMLWLGTTMALAGAALSSSSRDRWAALAAVAAPVSIVASIFGQNAFLTTGLIGFALVALPRRPILAGVLIGLMGFKPQLGLALPLILMAGGHWRAFLAAGATVIASVALSIALFGLETWVAFLSLAGASREKLMENSSVGFAKLQSLFASLRYYDVPLGVAYGAQVALMLAVGITLVWLWRRPQLDYDLRAAGAATATLLITPFCLAYDLAIELVAIAFLLRLARGTGWLNGEIPALWVIAATPAIAAFWPEPPWFHAGLLGMVLLYGLILRRAMRSSGPAQSMPQGSL